MQAGCFAANSQGTAVFRGWTGAQRLALRPRSEPRKTAYSVPKSPIARRGMTIVTARRSIYTLAGVFWLHGIGGGVPLACRRGTGSFQALPYCENWVVVESTVLPVS